MCLTLMYTVNVFSPLIPGKATLRVSDSQLNSDNDDLYFQAIQEPAIQIVSKSLVVATQGTVTALTSAVLDLSTQEQPEDVKISVIQGKA